MGIYPDQLLPRFQDKVMARKATREVRVRVCAGLAGEVVEVGFGTGLNAPHYPAGVTRLSPSSHRRSACASLPPASPDPMCLSSWEV